MAAAVLVPMSAINLNGGVLPPSAISHATPRGGRGRAGSMTKGKGRGRVRGLSLVEERDAVVSKALEFVLKRAQTKSVGSEGENENTEGWMDLDDLLEHPKMAGLNVTLAEVQRAVASSTRLAMRLSSPEEDAEDPASYEIRRVTATTQAHQESSLEISSTWTTLTPDMEDLPELIAYETSFPKYHLILTSGSIKRANGQPHLSFSPVLEDLEDARPARDSDVSIWIPLREAMAQSAGITWMLTDSGNIVTADEVPKSLWKKAFARRGELGVLFEDGEIRKEIPVGLRRKGVKGGKKDRGVLKSRTVPDEESSSASD